MTLRMPRFLGDLYAHADPQAERPTAPAIGVDADGRFRTVVHKEYPRRLSSGLAHALASQLWRDLRARHVREPANLPPPLHTWVKDILPATAQKSDPKRPGCLTIKVEAFGVNSRIMQVGSKDLTPLCACESESEIINRFL